MPALSDAELKKRLEAHNYTVPPITGTTRNLLEKKLAQLDGESAKSKKGRAKKPAATTTNLIDYSSAEEEQYNTKTASENTRRRTSTSSRNQNTSRNINPVSQASNTSNRSLRSSRTNTPQQPAVSSSSYSTNGTTKQSTSDNNSLQTEAYHRLLTTNGGSTIKNGQKSTRQSGLIHFSENEEESDEDGEEDESEDEEEEDVEDEELEDDDDELEDDEHSYEDEEESQFTGGINLGIQTSPGLDDTVDSGNLNGGGARFRGGSTSGSSRFVSSTPTPAVKSTSAYFNSPHPQGPSLSGNTKSRPAFSLNSPLRRHVAGNSKAYGSLGEALASLPMSGHRNNAGLSHASTAWSNIPSSSSNSHHSTHPSTNSNNYVPTHGGASVNASDLTTQVSRSSNQNINAHGASAAGPYNNNNRSTYCTSQNISKLIIVVAGIFFMILSYKYATLRPSIDIERLVCIEESRTKDIRNSEQHHTCVPKDIEHEVTNMTRDLVNILETSSVEILCNQEGEISKNNSLSITEILQILNEEKQKDDTTNVDEKQENASNEYDLKSNGFDDVNNGDLDEDYDDEVPHYRKTAQNKETLNYQNKLDPKLKKNFKLILSLIQENPQWGIQINCDSDLPCTKSNTNKNVNIAEEDEDDHAQDENEISYSFDKTYLILTNPPINWDCWLRIRASSTFNVVISLLVKLLYLSVVVALAYGVYRLYCWRQEKKIREEQDIFELVEQVLSMLVAQHQQYHALAAAANVSVSQGSNSSSLAAKPCVAVNHIRDQLIPPTDRKRKQYIWSRVVKYIRESESRVREDVQTIYGEEHLVWQWIPDIHWSPMNHNGPNPYPYSTPPRIQPNNLPHPSMASSAANYHHSVSHAGTSHTMMTPTMHSTYKPNSTSTPISSPAGTISPPWQGPAFNSLNRNVAAPTIAPTSCLKIRHMFDPQSIRKNSSRSANAAGTGWIWLVKEEILRRCSATNPPASILHIAVDTENAEGCVYVKAQNTEEAGKVFKTLHGQWYRGNLVTVKYLREERYHERFPDAQNQRIPLRASIQLQPL